MEGSSAVWLGTPSFVVLEVVDDGIELVISIETTRTFVGCTRCGTRARPKDRRWVSLRDRQRVIGRCCCAGGSGSGHALIPTVRPARGPNSPSSLMRGACSGGRDAGVDRSRVRCRLVDGLDRDRTPDCQQMASHTAHSRYQAEELPGTRAPSWQVSTTPAISPSSNPTPAPSGISCPNAMWCMGVWDTSSPTYDIAVATWNGQSWTALSFPSTGYGGLYATGVTCWAPAACVLYGESNVTAGLPHTFATMWNGSGWTDVSSVPTISTLEERHQRPDH